MAHDRDEIFVEGKEHIVGHVSTDSGSIIIADGIVEPELQTPMNRRIAIDLHIENVSIPVIATKQNGRKFLLIPVDAGEPIPPAAGTMNPEQVKVEGNPAKEPEGDTDDDSGT